MRVHDWSRVHDGVFHGFHGRWITGLTITLNSGVLPKGFYADGEQVIRPTVPDVLALRTPPSLFNGSTRPEGGVALADAPPRTRVRVALPPASDWPEPRVRRLAVRHVSGHQVVALIEVVSTANKDRALRVEEFAVRVADSLRAGIHVLVIDILPPGRHDPDGMHGAVLAELGSERYQLPPNEPLTLASYRAGSTPEAFVEHLRPGLPLPPMPLFLTPERYVDVPLEPGYDLAWSGTPEYYRDVLEPPA